MPWIVTGAVMNALTGVLVVFVAWLIYFDTLAIGCVCRSRDLDLWRRIVWATLVVVMPVGGAVLAWNMVRDLDPEALPRSRLVLPVRFLVRPPEKELGDNPFASQYRGSTDENVTELGRSEFSSSHHHSAGSDGGHSH